MTLIRREAMPAVQDAATPSTSRVRKFIASDESVDSYNTVLKSTGWELERYNRNSIVQLFHDGRRFPVGKGTARIVGKQLELSVEFAPADDPVSGPDAEQALRWIDRGVLGVSVGFQPLEEEYDESRETGDMYKDLFNPPLNYTRMELFEVSIVNVPANPNALPMGREALQRSAERFLVRNTKAPAPVEAPAISRVALEALTKRITEEEVRAHLAQKTGNLGGITK